MKHTRATKSPTICPTGERFDVFIPSYGAPVADPEAHYNSRGASTQYTAAILRRLRPQAFETGDFVLCQYTALHLAAREGHIDIVNSLLEHGASLDIPSRWFCPCDPPRGLWQTFLDPVTRADRGVGNWSPLHVAICFSRIEVAKCLISRGARSSKGPDNRAAAYMYEALHQAAAACHADLVGYILDLHPEMDIDWRDNLDLTPLYHACANCRWDSTVPLLLARGVDLNSRFRLLDANSGNELLELTSLGEACRLGRFEDALKLIDLGADVNLGLREPERGPDPRRFTQIRLLHVCCMKFQPQRPGAVSAQGAHLGSSPAAGSLSIKGHFQTACCWQESRGNVGPWRLPRGDAPLAGCKA